MHKVSYNYRSPGPFLGTSVLVPGREPDQSIKNVCYQIHVTPPFQGVGTGSFNLLYHSSLQTRTTRSLSVLQRIFDCSAVHILSRLVLICCPQVWLIQYNFRQAVIMSFISRLCFSEKKPFQPQSFSCRCLETNSKTRCPLSYFSAQCKSNICSTLTWRAAQTKRRPYKNEAHAKGHREVNYQAGPQWLCLEQ